MKSAVRLIKVTKSFQKEQVLKGITHSFEQGKIHGITGFNGSGKTVMFKCICGFLKPDSGTVFVQGQQIGRDADFPRSVGMIIENPGFLPHLSGFANLKRLAAIQRKITDEQIRKSIARAGLDPFSRKKWDSILWECGNVLGSRRRSWRSQSFWCWTSRLTA